MKYKHIFFDLDRTLWDFETNSLETLNELIFESKLQVDAIKFIECYQEHNKRLWNDYGLGLVDKEQLRSGRFQKAFADFNIQDDSLISFFSDEYVSRSPLKKNLLPFSHEILQYLGSRYVLHIITNGFEEVQHVKMQQCNISGYFKEIITSEKAGAKKPSADIFNYALSVAGADITTSLMIGDSWEADIEGARNAGIDQVFICRSENERRSNGATYHIDCLSELRTFL